MLTTGNISLGPFVGLLDSMKNTNTSLRVITLKIFFRPVFNESEPINVTFGLNLQQIVDLVSFPGILIEDIAHFLFTRMRRTSF